MRGAEGLGFGDLLDAIPGAPESGRGVASPYVMVESVEEGALRLSCFADALSIADTREVTGASVLREELLRRWAEVYQFCGLSESGDVLMWQPDPGDEPVEMRLRVRPHTNDLHPGGFCPNGHELGVQGGSEFGGEHVFFAMEPEQFDLGASRLMDVSIRYLGCEGAAARADFLATVDDGFKVAELGLSDADRLFGVFGGPARRFNGCVERCGWVTSLARWYEGPRS